MSVCDGQGLHITCRPGVAASEWMATQTAFLAHCASTPAALGRALGADPNFVLGWAAKGLFYALLRRAELAGPAGEALAKAKAAREAVGATDRESHYIDALEAALAGRLSRAVAIFERLLARYPQDALALKLDHAFRFLLGDRRGMARMAREYGPAFGRGHPFEGYVRGIQSFAMEEMGAFDEAETHGRVALEIAHDDAWGLHAVAHVYDMTAQTDQGVDWLLSQQDVYAHCNNFGAHVWWHLGLFLLDQGNYDAVLELYDERIRAEKTDDYRDIANGASMLTRLEIEGVDVGDRWEELAELSAGRVEDASLVFADLHYMLALNGGDRPAEADALVARLAADAQRSDHDMHEVAAVAGHRAAEGLAAFRAGHYGAAFDALREVRPTLQRVGGSHAQRDVFSRLMIEAGIRARRYEDAEAELRERALRRGADDGFTHRRLEAIARARQAERLSP